MRRDDVQRALRLVPVRLGPWLAFLRRSREYRTVSAEDLRTSRRSDTIFIFGSGASLNEIPEAEWRAFEEHDTLGFNWFVHQRFVRCDLHLIRGIPDTDLDPAVWRPQLEEYFGLLRSNPRFDETVVLLHSGFRAINGNRAVGYGYLPKRNPVFYWRTNDREPLPTESFSAGLAHGHSTIQECINFAYLLGWTRIVLAGVDLYDRRYFWQPNEVRSVDVGRNATLDEPHSRATSGMIDELAAWADWLRDRGVELSIHNPRSLLARGLPVYRSASHSR